MPPPAGKRGTAPCKNRARIFKAAVLEEPCSGAWGPGGMPRASQAGRRRQAPMAAHPHGSARLALAKRTGLAQPSLPERTERRNCVTLMSS